MSISIGFVWQDPGSGGSAGMTAMRSWKLRLCPIKQMWAGSKTDPLVAKAKSINDSGSAFGITCVRKGEENLHSSSQRKEWEAEEVVQAPEQRLHKIYHISRFSFSPLSHPYLFNISHVTKGIVGPAFRKVLFRLQNAGWLQGSTHQE